MINYIKYNMMVGDIKRITIVERAACGLVWDFDAIKKSDLIELITFEQQPFDPKMVGGPVNYDIEFKAIKSGVITMDEKRPWDSDIVQTMTITIN